MKKETISLKDDVVVTRENVMTIGEVIAVRAVKIKKRFEGRNLYQLEKGMLYDIYHKKSTNSTYSDGYDIVQESICFLCQFIGKRLGDIIQKSKHGKGYDTLRNACYKHIHAYLRRQIVVNKELECNEELDIVKVDTDCLKEPEDFTRVNVIIKKLQLTKNELKVLQGFYNGLTYDNVAEFANLNRKTVYLIKMKLREKYTTCFA